MEKKPTIYAKFWTSNYNEGEHFKDHGKQTGHDNNDEGKKSYSEEAYKFFKATGKDTISFKANEKGKYATYKFNKITNEFMIISKDGKIVTYYPARDGLKYFIRQFDKYGDFWN